MSVWIFVLAPHHDDSFSSQVAVLLLGKTGTSTRRAATTRFCGMIGVGGGGVKGDMPSYMVLPVSTRGVEYGYAYISISTPPVGRTTICPCGYICIRMNTDAKEGT